MSKGIFDNHVYLVICDISIDVWKKTKFTTYFEFCRYVKIMITSKMKENYQDYVVGIYNSVNLFFCMDMELMVDYILRYFIDDEWLYKYDAINGIRDCFDHYTDIKLN